MILDLTLNENIVTNNIWEAALQELDILFETRATELIGYPRFGTYFEQFLWSTTPMTSELEKYVNEVLGSTAFFSKIRHHIEIINDRDESTYENVYMVKITMYDDFHAIEKTYNLTKDEDV